MTTATTTQAEDQIRRAYAYLATKANPWVMIADLQERGDWNLARELPRMEIECPDVILIPAANQKVLTDADRAARIWRGGQWVDAVRMGA